MRRAAAGFQARLIARWTCSVMTAAGASAGASGSASPAAARFAARTLSAWPRQAHATARAYCPISMDPGAGRKSAYAAMHMQAGGPHTGCGDPCWVVSAVAHSTSHQS